MVCLSWVKLLCCSIKLTGGSNQIKSNHFYCHITTAQVPWWVKFLWACSRQCRKTTDNLHMDRQCKKNNNSNLHMDRQCKKKKKNSNLHMDRQCKKKTTTAIYIWTDSAKKTTTAIYIWTDSAKKNKKKKQQQFTYGQTVQKKTPTAIYIWTDSAKKTTTAIYIWTDSAKKTTAIYIWTVHIYRLYRRQCAKYTYMHSVRLVYYRDILNYQRHIIHVQYLYIMWSIHSSNVRCNRL